MVAYTILSVLGLTLTAMASPVPAAEPGLLSGVTGAVSGVTGTVSSVVAPVVSPVVKVVESLPALLQGTCGSQFDKCTLTVNGKIENILVDGKDVAGIASVSAWMQDGHGYASADLAGNLPIPWTILCNANTGVCTGTVSGNVTQVFANGQQLALWGWATPTGYCDKGICYGSLTALGDPAY